MSIKIRRLAATLGVAALTAALLVGIAPTAQALSGNEFDPGHIISDEVFFNSGSMNEAQVQSWLEQQMPSCRGANGYACLRDYRTDTFSRAAAEAGHCGAYAGAAAERASSIIVKVAKACRINPQVLLVMLQKEQALVTAQSPTERQYRVAMGYGCPDTADCDAQFFGFYNQVYKAAWQLRQYTNHPARTYRIGSVSIPYHPNSACGSSVVNIRNQATANLYNYTPYRPNAAALANLRGTGDACSAYGNRNFWVFFNDWFGSPTGDSGRSNPIGNIELVEAKPGAFHVAGWTLDPDNADSLSIHVYVGAVSSAHPANIPRGDVGAAYPANGAAHGFDVTVPAQGAGDTPVCIYAINSGPGVNVLLGCVTRTAKSGSPVGALADVRTTPSGIEAVGWALDPDTKSPISIHVYVDSTSSAHSASSATTAVPAAYAEYGSNHGFGQPVAASPGTHNVCVYAINTGPGWHVNLGCRQVVVPGGSGIPEQGRVPIGHLEMVRGGSGEVEVSGWAIDPDTANPISVHVYADSVGVAITANGDRADVAAAYPLYGQKHGFSHKMAAPPGTRSVCAYAINTGAGGHTLLGCQTVEVLIAAQELGRAPIGVLEGASVDATGITASGWSIDPDTTSPIQVHVYVDGTGAAVTANIARADVARTFAGYGPSHGFAHRMAAAPGPHTVCAYGINAGPGGHAALGCKQVVVPGASTPDLGRAPFGTLEAVIPKAGAVDVGGWAIDPDTASPISVHVYVDSVGVAVNANIERGDVAAHYPSYGTPHGYWTTVPAAPGQHTVCAYAINNGAGGHTALGCQAITVP